MKKTLQLDFTNKASNVSITMNGVSKIWGEGLGWTRAEAEAVLSDHSRYIEDLKLIGIQTSVIISRNLSRKEDGSYVIEDIEEYSGKDASVALLDALSASELRGLTRSYFRSVIQLLLSIPPRDAEKYSAKQPWVKVPIDLKPQNVVINALTNDIVVIDTFGPKLWLNGKIKPLPTRIPGKGQILHDEIKVGDIRFSIGRLNGYFVALATRWLVNNQPSVSVKEMDKFRFSVADITAEIIEETVIGNELFDSAYANQLIADTSENELRSMSYGSYEGPRYVQALYEKEISI